MEEERSRTTRALEILRRTAVSAKEDRLTGLGAEVAFFSILSLPPTVLAVFGTIGYLAESLGPGASDEIRSQVIGAASRFLTPAATEWLGRTLEVFLSEGRAGVASVGLVLALWSASRATNAAIVAVNIAYNLTETRSAYKRRLIAFGMTTLGILGAVAIIPLVVAGPRLGAAIGRPLGLGEAFATLWRVGYWPGVGLLGFAVLTTFYHFAPSWRTPWRREVPGAVAALLVWLAGGAALRLYAIISIQGASAYRGLAAPIVLLLWIYITALAVLVGAELNAEIERAYPTIDGPSGPLAQANEPASSTSASPSPSEPHTPMDSEGRTV